MFRSAPRPPDRQPEGAADCRAYIVGDVHGRLDLLKVLLGKIHHELDREPAGRCLLVFLGDLIDRGPNSAQVIERLRTYNRPAVEPVFLLGNHEEVLLRILDGDAELITKWRWFGGSECLASYGVNPDELAAADEDQALAMVRAAIPMEHVEFIQSFADSYRFGDYLFVHAGIRPGIELERQTQSDLRWIRDPFLNDKSDHGVVVVHAGIRPGIELERQTQSDLRWIRDPFLNDKSDHGVVVVHGHTISSSVEVRPNRIGIDTGAYKTGVLTALGLEGSDRWLLDTSTKSFLLPHAR